MADHPSLQENEVPINSMGMQLSESTKNSRSIQGPITRNILNTVIQIDGERLRKETFGVKDPRKPHKVILMVGETGSGKSTLINAMVNYMLGVQCNDRVWWEIIETKESQTKSQTNAVTVYDVFVDQSPFSLTAIDTPGYGSTEDPKGDLTTNETLYELFKDRHIGEIDVVGLVIPSHTSRLTDRQLRIFDAILSLFGKDVERNIVLLITRSPRSPKGAIKAVKESVVRCAKTHKGEPVYFPFDNSHCETFNEENWEEDQEQILQMYKAALILLNASMSSFFGFLNNCSSVSMKLTESVLKNRIQLMASVDNLKGQILLLDIRTEELEQTKAALVQQQECLQGDFTWEVDESYKEKVPIKPAWWEFSKKATSCSVCEENCHYPGCWWVRDVSRCSVMKAGKYTVCSGRCDSTQHVKEGKVYKIKTRKAKRSLEELKNRYEKKWAEKESLISRLQEEIGELEIKKTRLVEDCYECMVVLEEIALKTDAMATLPHLDFVIEKVKETGRFDRVKKLEELKNRT